MRNRGGIFWGLVLILVAGLLLLREMDLIQGNIFGYFWPILIILFGIWMIVSFFRRGQGLPAGNHHSLALGNAASARLKLEHGAGRLKLHSGCAPSNLLEGVFGNEVELRTRMDGEQMDVLVRNTPQVFLWVPGDSLDWDLSLNRDIPLILRIDSGASTTVLDLSDLKVDQLRLETGASTTDLTLPAHAGSSRVDINAGAATLRLNVPSGVAARIRVESAIATLNVDTQRFPLLGEHVYQSADFSTAANRAEVTIEAGVGTITIQ